jgi:putative membrane protein
MIGTFFFGACAIIFTSYLLAIGVPLHDTKEAIVLALEVSLLVGILNVTVKPFLKIVTIPFHILSLGLFAFVINGFLFVLIAKAIPEFIMPSFLQAIYFAFIFTFVMRVYHIIADEND